MGILPECYVFGAGEFFGGVPEVSEHDIVIAADGGYAALERLGLKADYVIGDFDSLPEIPPQKNITRMPQEKDVTDMRAALELGLKKGFEIFHIYGGTGGRFEHTLANIQCLAWLAQSGARGYLYDKDCTMTAITNGSLSYDEKCSGYISVFAHSGTANGIYLSGLKYPLDNATVTDVFPLGVSNEFTGTCSTVTVKDGTLIVIYPAGTAPVILCP